MSRARDIADLIDANGDIVADALDNVPEAEAFPSGTLMLFQQTASPTGWTKETTHNDKSLRVVSGTAGSGGSVAFTTARSEEHTSELQSQA